MRSLGGCKSTDDDDDTHFPYLLDYGKIARISVFPLPLTIRNVVECIPRTHV